MALPNGSIVGFFDERDDRESMLVGGYYIPRKGLRELDLGMKKIKDEYGLSEEVPVKWNLKDPVCAEAREAIGTKVDDFREDLFGRLKTLDIRVKAGVFSSLPIVPATEIRIFPYRLVCEVPLHSNLNTFCH